ncbi:glycosyltransferase family 2 protein [Cyanobium sp. N5-Cardenillas]|uniref:glycosyltransferase family 2 protein n=1 Tax=Cyanobium sp. N5-Cardenillas TaxID=2823720 RepID=UPI0039655ED1|nr:glycosyltransferase family 2 protein [Cyanobium sp. N5-Cardenillas]
MSDPAISVVCAYRNGSAFLPELLASVQRQVMAHWELLLVDDGSTDGGPLLAAEAASSDSRIRPMSAPPRPTVSPAGPWWPRNIGIGAARAPWIAFLDVDDLWHPLKLERQLALHRTLGLDLSVTGYARFHHGRPKLSSWRCPPQHLQHRGLLRGNVIPLLTVMVRRDWLEEGFRPVPHEDYLLWLDLFRQRPHLKYGCLPELLAAYRLHDANLTARRPALAAWVYGVHRCHGRRRFQSAAVLLPWASHQLCTALDWRLRPLTGSLNQALSAVPPWLLPPVGLS